MIIREGSLLMSAPEIGLIHFIPAEIIPGKGSHFKISRAVQIGDVMLRDRHLRNCGLRDLTLHNVALCRIVVNEDKAVGADVDLVCDLNKIPVLGVPVCLDDQKIIRMENRVRTIQPGQCIFLVVFGINVQENAEVRVFADVVLEFTVKLGGRRFLADFDVLRTIVTDNAAPEGVVEIQNQRFLVFAVNGFDDVEQIKGKLRNRRNCESIFIHVPVIRICPLCQSVTGGKIVDVLDVKIVMGLRIMVKKVIQPACEIQLAVDIRDVAVAEKTVKGLFKIVLNDRAVILRGNPVPHLLKRPVGRIQHAIHILCRGPDRRKFTDVPRGSVNIDQIRGKRDQLRIVEHNVLPVLGIFGFIENRFNSIVQKEELQYFPDVTGCGTAENGNFLGNARSLILQESSAE